MFNLSVYVVHSCYSGYMVAYNRMIDCGIYLWRHCMTWKSTSRKRLQKGHDLRGIQSSILWHEHPFRFYSIITKKKILNNGEVICWEGLNPLTILVNEGMQAVACRKSWELLWENIEWERYQRSKKKRNIAYL